ncbi:hypothetical protein DB347_09605 [Opitutaceae bacterium EW11]|nr:hypothetical protein DB347_09605 [Opitutaceae bacterium EW11]
MATLEWESSPRLEILVTECDWPQMIPVSTDVFSRPRDVVGEALGSWQRLVEPAAMEIASSFHDDSLRVPFGTRVRSPAAEKGVVLVYSL